MPALRGRAKAQLACRAALGLEPIQGSIPTERAKQPCLSSHPIDPFGLIDPVALSNSNRSQSCPSLDAS